MATLNELYWVMAHATTAAFGPGGTPELRRKWEEASQAYLAAKAAAEPPPPPPPDPASMLAVCRLVEAVANDARLRYSFRDARSGTSVYYWVDGYGGGRGIKVRIADHDRWTWNTDLWPDVDLRPGATLDEVRTAIFDAIREQEARHAKTAS